MNSEEYETDFDPLVQRNASAIRDWSQYVPRKRSLLGVPRYTNFFKSIEYFASTNNSKKPGLDLQTHLAKLYIRTVLSEQKSIISTGDFKKLLSVQKKDQNEWIERTLKGEKFTDIINEIIGVSSEA